MTVEEAIKQKVEAEMTIFNLYQMNVFNQSTEYLIDLQRMIYEAQCRLYEAKAVLQQDMEKAGKKP